MRFKEDGKRLKFLRYAGVIEGKTVESKIGSVGVYCKPIVVEQELPPDSNEGIPSSLWRKLTIEEQEKLMGELQKREQGMNAASWRLAARSLEDLTQKMDAVTPELADLMWERMAALQKALKKAGHPKPHHAEKVPQSASSTAADTKTAQLPLED